MLSLALIAGGVSYLAAYLPKHAPLGPAVGLLVELSPADAVRMCARLATSGYGELSARICP